MILDFLKEKLENCYTNDEIEKIIDGLSCTRKTTFRINRLKITNEKISNILDGLGIIYERQPDFEDAFILQNYDHSKKLGFDTKTGLSIEEMEMYKKGMIYMQSLSSMKPVYILSPQKGENILDMCAAPGSKTTMIQSITGNKVNLTACELHKDRFERLKFNVEKQGANVYLLNQNACDLNDMLKFDKILLDAPCTGTGVIDIHHDRINDARRASSTKEVNFGNGRTVGNNFTNELLNRCVATQKKLIKKASKLLKKGGEMVYSTCSLLKEENEDMVEYATKCGFILDKEKVIKILPDEIFEGFFIAKFLLK